MLLLASASPLARTVPLCDYIHVGRISPAGGSARPLPYERGGRSCSKDASSRG